MQKTKTVKPATKPYVAPGRVNAANRRAGAPVNRNKSTLNRKFSETVDWLKDWLERAHRLSTFELYSDLLSMGGRRKLLERIGAEAGDPIDQFLAQILEYDRTNVPTLQGFVNWLSNGNHEIKRDMETDGSNKVRIMTVHGAKGLQLSLIHI